MTPEAWLVQLHCATNAMSSQLAGGNDTTEELRQKAIGPERHGGDRSLPQSRGTVFDKVLSDRQAPTIEYLAVRYARGPCRS